MPEKRAFEGKYASFKNIKFLRGNYQTDSFETETLYCLNIIKTCYCLCQKFTYYIIFKGKTLISLSYISTNQRTTRRTKC